MQDSLQWAGCNQPGGARCADCEQRCRPHQGERVMSGARARPGVFMGATQPPGSRRYIIPTVLSCSLWWLSRPQQLRLRSSQPTPRGALRPMSYEFDKVRACDGRVTPRFPQRCVCVLAPLSLQPLRTRASARAAHCRCTSSAPPAPPTDAPPAACHTVPGVHQFKADGRARAAHPHGQGWAGAGLLHAGQRRLHGRCRPLQRTARAVGGCQSGRHAGASTMPAGRRT